MQYAHDKYSGIYKVLMCICLFLLAINFANADNVIIGGARINDYSKLLTNKKVAVFANNASKIESQNIVDFLLANKINVVKIFTPEHGFFVDGAAGQKINDGIYKNIPLISLYGKNLAPTEKQLRDIDVSVFDIQDVGVRYYTYISSLQYIMQASLKNAKTLIILDRPNPNGFYIDGPVLEKSYLSFVGMQAIPIVYGMTIGEYALMLKGENWLETSSDLPAKDLKLIVVKNLNYTHATKYIVKYPPSPNLKTIQAIYNYPSLGWFEGTKMSVGRGTQFPFELLGKYDLRAESYSQPRGEIDVSLLINSYKTFSDKKDFFNAYFNKLAGNKTLKEQIISDMSESQIRASWQKDIAKFKKIRAKYLIYP